MCDAHHRVHLKDFIVLDVDVGPRNLESFHSLNLIAHNGIKPLHLLQVDDVCSLNLNILFKILQIPSSN